MVAANGGFEEAECNIRRNFGDGKGAALGIQQVQRGWEKQRSSGVWCRE